MHIQSLVPTAWPDLQRVSVLVRVSGLPAYGSSAGPNLFLFPDLPGAGQAGWAGSPTLGQPPSDVEGLPAEASPETRAANDPAQLRDSRTPSPYPDLVLSVLDQHGREMATTYIVEHKEPELEFTLHLPAAEPGATYVAQAKMSWNDEVIQTVQVPFEVR